MSDGPEWFAPKRFGLGAGLPIAWQGWAVTLGFIALVAFASLQLHHSQLAYFSVVATLTIVFLIISAKTTRGGWKWRWGDDD